MNATPSNDKPLSRKGFIGWLMKGILAGTGLLGLAALGRYTSFQSEASPPTQFDAGLASNYPLGSRTVIGVAQAIIMHENQGFIALSLVCPHLGCEVNVTNEGFACPCHGSRFTPAGNLHKGPASKPLTSLRVEVDSAGHLILSTG